ncbi:polysaccharide biosynthesis/export family protein [Formosa sp. PL04]|uniref:polysaccharide biosynthesis/export family protein n=1 Tax=Formosa sp. PL04 TaxID=3081755 RepID=UPI0029815C40|nr:polysaccharide biosynthesis/export family protein [Formosa sp. PL04]MDW5287860.1 polysaccharide biosynthesis/export family protein [Formosa sp. PL04]
MKLFRMLGLFLAFLFVNSCASKKEILYFQDYENIPKDVIINATKIQINDILSISVKSLVSEAAEPYNRNNNSGGGNSTEMMKLNGYLVSSTGSITFPILGVIQVNNKTTPDLEVFIKNILIEEGHLKDPTVIVRIVNAKFTVLGEVGSPGTYDYDEETITLPQAIGMAGDLSINGVRGDVMIIREVDQVRTVAHIDMTKTDWFTSPYYNIKQNDIIVVNPNGPEVLKSGYFTSVGALMGLVSFVITLVLLLKS